MSRTIRLISGYLLILLVIAPLSAKELSYGFIESIAEVHVFLTNQYWYYGEQTFGNYANEGKSSLAGKGVFIPMSAYIDISSWIRPNVMGEVEFELYKGASVKICKLRIVWSPEEWFVLSLGRDFVPIGPQDKTYYPPARFRIFTIGPFLYRKVMRYSGWWDTGVHLSGRIPITGQAAVLYNVSGFNGPGQSSTSKMLHTNDDGYMYELFVGGTRQALDNNKNKAACVRLALSPIKELEFGGSFLKAKYDPDDQYGIDFHFGHLLFGSERLDLAAEYGRIVVEVDPTQNTRGDSVVTQSSAYAAASYKILKDHAVINYIAPALRYEIFDPWEEHPDNIGERSSLSMGINISPWKYCIFKAAYQMTWEKVDPQLENDGWSFEAVIEF
jgi:hypothetical protein